MVISMASSFFLWKKFSDDGLFLQEILQFSKDYRQMSSEKASIDFHYKIEHYKEQYESMDSKIEPTHSFIKVFNGGTCIIFS